MAPVTYISGFIDRPRDSLLFHRLWNELNWERREQVPRNEYWTNLFNQSYTYGRSLGIRTYDAQRDHEVIREIRERLSNEYDAFLEGCFLNGYKDASDALGWHADDDPAIDHSKPIAVITLGQPRAIQFREVISPGSEMTKAVFGTPAEKMLESGSLLLMHPGMQFSHQHRIPKAGYVAGPRISLTYRGLIKRD